MRRRLWTWRGLHVRPMSGVCEAKGQVKVSPTHPYVSTATMVAPSPDWFAPHLCPACSRRVSPYGVLGQLG